MFRKLIAPLIVFFCLMCAQDAFAVEQIVFSPSSPGVNEKITFRAVGWDTTGCILWYFGDGDLNEDAIDPYTTTHSYSRAGTYTVRAHYGCDPSATPTTVTVRVGETLGPEAPFSISFIQLRFEDGKAYKAVSKDMADIRAYADIKYEGTGTLRIQWLVDGKPFTFSSQLLSFARQTTIDTGKGLPTQIPGTHDVTLRFIQPAVEFEIPVIRYFVGLSDAGPPPGIGLSIKSVTDSEGKSLSILGNTLKAAGSENVILTGEIENKEMRAFPLGRLSIYLGDRLVDQQVIKNLNPGEKRAFDVSILNPTDTLEKATFVLADEAGRVLQKSTLNLQPLTPPEITPPPVKISSDVVLPPKDLKDIPEPATLPGGVVAQLKIRPRKIFSTQDNVELDYFVKNFLYVHIYCAWDEVVKYGSTAFYEDIRIHEDKTSTVFLWDEKQSSYAKGQMGIGVYNDPMYVIFEGVYYDPRSKEPLHSDRLGKYYWSQVIDTYPRWSGPPTISVSQWEAMNTDFTSFVGGDIRVTYPVDPLPQGYLGVSVDIKATIHNSSDHDAGKIQVGVDKIHLPPNWICQKAELPYLEGNSKKDVFFNIIIPPGEIPEQGKSYYYDLFGKADLEDKYSKKFSGSENKEFKFRVWVERGKPGSKGPGSKGPGSVLGYRPQITEFDAARKSIFEGEYCSISYNVQNVRRGNIVKIDPATWQTAGVIKDFNDGRTKGIIHDYPEKTTIYKIAVYGPPQDGTEKPAEKFIGVVVHKKGDFQKDDPAILYFKSDKDTLQAGNTCSLSYEFKFAGYAEIMDKVTGESIRVLKTATNGNSVKGSVTVKPSATTTYILSCINPYSENSKEVTVRVTDSRSIKVLKSEPDIRKFAPRISLIDFNQPAVMDIIIDNVKEAKIRDKNTRKEYSIYPKNGAYSGTFTLTPERTTDYVLEAKNDKGKSTRTATVFLPEDKPVINSFGYEGGPLINHGESVGLLWDYEYAQEARIIDKYSGKVITTLSSGPASARGRLYLKPDHSITYQLVLTNPNGKAVAETAHFIVNYPAATYINKPLIYSFKADKSTVSGGQSCRLLYEFTDAETAIVSDAGTGIELYRAKTDKPGNVVKGEIIAKPDKTIKYELKCENPNGADKATVEVIVK